MSTFRVTLHAVAGVADHLGTVSGGVRELHGRLGTHRGAGGGTPAGAALDDLFGHWSSVLPIFSSAGDHLAGAVAGAATAYAVSDGVIGGACAEAAGSGAGGRGRDTAGNRGAGGGKGR